MARYLIVAHQTATSPALVSRVRAMLAVEPGAEFVVLVPATPVEQLPWYAEGDARSLARRVRPWGRVWSGRRWALHRRW